MGPLHGIRILELAGIGPGPFCGMLLADLGAEVWLVDRKGGSLPFNAPPKFDITRRGKRSIAVDLKKPGAAEVVLGLVERCDGLIEGFRPGVMERLGLGPDMCLARNPCTSALMSAQLSVIAVSITCPRPVLRAFRIAASRPTAMNIAPPPMSPTTVGGIAGTESLWPPG